MRDAPALSHYLERHAEKALPDCPAGAGPWAQVLVIPAYRESPALLERLLALHTGDRETLVILLLNRPDSDPDATANAALREAALALPRNGHALHSLSKDCSLYLYDLETLTGPTPSAQGVGLVRKTGCDLALKWMQAGAIDCHWLCCTDADATLPADYFARLAQVDAGHSAVAWPFHHAATGDLATTRATALYELRLHHYTLGLEYARSPYAMHTLGSCMAINAHAYAKVRGMPRRPAAEDFYLLNKLAKIAPVARPGGACIQLSSRASDRAPFGTGPSVTALAAMTDPGGAAIFYDPRCYMALRAALAVLQQAHAPQWQLDKGLADTGLERDVLEHCFDTLVSMGIANALAHCRRQSRTPATFHRHLRDWFDGFRTLKFIHGLRDRHWPLVDLKTLAMRLPADCPLHGGGEGDIDRQRAALRDYWCWTA